MGSKRKKRARAAAAQERAWSSAAGAGPPHRKANVGDRGAGSRDKGPSRRENFSDSDESPAQLSIGGFNLRIETSPRKGHAGPWNAQAPHGSGYLPGLPRDVAGAMTTTTPALTVSDGDESLDSGDREAARDYLENIGSGDNGEEGLRDIIESMEAFVRGEIGAGPLVEDMGPMDSELNDSLFVGPADEPSGSGTADDEGDDDEEDDDDGTAAEDDGTTSPAPATRHNTLATGSEVSMASDDRDAAELDAHQLAQQFPFLPGPPRDAGNAGRRKQGAGASTKPNKSAVRGAAGPGGRALLPGEQKRLRKEAIRAKRAARAAKAGFDLHALQRRIDAFVAAGGEDDLCALPPMPKEEMRLVNRMAALYGVKTGLSGNGKKRFVVLHATNHMARPSGAAFGPVREMLELQDAREAAGARGGGGVAERQALARQAHVRGVSAPVGPDPVGQAPRPRRTQSRARPRGSHDADGAQPMSTRFVSGGVIADVAAPSGRVEIAEAGAAGGADVDMRADADAGAVPASPGATKRARRQLDSAPRMTAAALRDMMAEGATNSAAALFPEPASLAVVEDASPGGDFDMETPPLYEVDVDGVGGAGLGAGDGRSGAEDTAAVPRGFAEWERHTGGFGSRLMSQMGFKPGTGLGKNRQGITEPLTASRRAKRAGLGTGPESSGHGSGRGGRG